MRPYELILKKREGGELSEDEIAGWIRGVTDGSVSDAQSAALLMAILFRGMTESETTALTLAMANSGRQLDLSLLPGVKVDKHSSGGVGDKTTLILAPLAAAGGVTVAKLSGRALGHTGGTLDKLESIPGLRVEMDLAAFLDVVERVGVAVASAGVDLAPADKKLYALRDATATVESVPLITASIMSKKLAGGADALVLDVKVGNGAFLPDERQATELARTCVSVARRAGRKAVAYLTSMDQPLGRTVGNALEVREAIETLKGGGPRDLRELVLVLGAEMLRLGRVEEDPAAARAHLERLLASGEAAERFQRMIEAQGGDPRVVDDPRRLPQAEVRVPVEAPAFGFVGAIATRDLGLASMALGAGRDRPGAPVDLAVGLEVACAVGDAVEAGEPLAWIHAHTPDQAQAVRTRVRDAFRLSQERPAPPALVRGRLAEEAMDET
ncbi:thymidine phosphorylase [Limnochorda pilosa]|uniref:Pyrimidine-nucleoside phosphorylase n=1 Tax=Limnochorda pilosa TaxID=1555112 RepID=A0A0K2SKC7_LIMPI|nr:thymidine phosphorylase [Limnochorda pilosa]BAS27550.1 pyrimidine-nucleoside phosphorylase [Limnochorda pilosa]